MSIVRKLQQFKKDHPALFWAGVGLLCIAFKPAGIIGFVGKRDDQQEGDQEYLQGVQDIINAKAAAGDHASQVLSQGDFGSGGASYNNTYYGAGGQQVSYGNWQAQVAAAVAAARNAQVQQAASGAQNIAQQLISGTFGKDQQSALAGSSDLQNQLAQQLAGMGLAGELANRTVALAIQNPSLAQSYIHANQQLRSAGVDPNATVSQTNYGAQAPLDNGKPPGGIGLPNASDEIYQSKIGDLFNNRVVKTSQDPTKPSYVDTSTGKEPTKEVLSQVQQFRSGLSGEAQGASWLYPNQVITSATDPNTQTQLPLSNSAILFNQRLGQLAGGKGLPLGGLMGKDNTPSISSYNSPTTPGSFPGARPDVLYALHQSGNPVNQDQATRVVLNAYGPSFSPDWVDAQARQKAMETAGKGLQYDNLTPDQKARVDDEVQREKQDYQRQYVDRFFQVHQANKDANPFQIQAEVMRTMPKPTPWTAAALNADTLKGQVEFAGGLAGKAADDLANTAADAKSQMQGNAGPLGLLGPLNVAGGIATQTLGGKAAKIQADRFVQQSKDLYTQANKDQSLGGDAEQTNATRNAALMLGLGGGVSQQVAKAYTPSFLQQAAGAGLAGLGAAQIATLPFLAAGGLSSATGLGSLAARGALGRAGLDELLATGGNAIRGGVQGALGMGAYGSGAGALTGAAQGQNLSQIIGGMPRSFVSGLLPGAILGAGLRVGETPASTLDSLPQTARPTNARLSDLLNPGRGAGMEERISPGASAPPAWLAKLLPTKDVNLLPGFDTETVRGINSPVQAESNVPFTRNGEATNAAQSLAPPEQGTFTPDALSQLSPADRAKISAWAGAPEERGATQPPAAGQTASAADTSNRTLWQQIARAYEGGAAPRGTAPEFYRNKPSLKEKVFGQPMISGSLVTGGYHDARQHQAGPGEIFKEGNPVGFEAGGNAGREQARQSAVASQAEMRSMDIRLNHLYPLMDAAIGKNGENSALAWEALRHPERTESLAGRITDSSARDAFIKYVAEARNVLDYVPQAAARLGLPMGHILNYAPEHIAKAASELEGGVRESAATPWYRKTRTSTEETPAEELGNHADAMRKYFNLVKNDLREGAIAHTLKSYDPRLVNVKSEGNVRNAAGYKTLPGFQGLEVHPDIYKHLNNLNTSADDAALLKGADKAGQVGKRLLLQGMFHAWNETGRFLSVKAGQLGNVLHGEQPFGKGPGVIPLLKNVLSSANHADYERSLIQDGTLDKMTHAGWAYGESPDFGKSRNPITKLIFNRVVPTLQAETFKSLEKQGKIDLSTPEGIARSQAFGRLVNNIYGTIDYDAINRNPTVQRFMRLGLLAPGFKEGGFKTLGTMFDPRVAPEVRTMARQTVVAQAVLTALATQVANKALGKQTQGIREAILSPLVDAGLVDKKTSKSIGFRPPTTLLQEATKTAETRGKFLLGALSPALQFGKNLTGKDWQGYPVSKTQAFEKLLPIATQTRGGTGAKAANFLFGLGTQNMPGQAGKTQQINDQRQEYTDKLAAGSQELSAQGGSFGPGVNKDALRALVPFIGGGQHAGQFKVPTDSGFYADLVGALQGDKSKNPALSGIQGSPQNAAQADLAFRALATAAAGIRPSVVMREKLLQDKPGLMGDQQNQGGQYEYQKRLIDIHNQEIDESIPNGQMAQYLTSLPVETQRAIYQANQLAAQQGDPKAQARADAMTPLMQGYIGPAGAMGRVNLQSAAQQQQALDNIQKFEVTKNADNETAGLALANKSVAAQTLANNPQLNTPEVQQAMAALKSQLKASGAYGQPGGGGGGRKGGGRRRSGGRSGIRRPRTGRSRGVSMGRSGGSRGGGQIPRILGLPRINPGRVQPLDQFMQNLKTLKAGPLGTTASGGNDASTVAPFPPALASILQPRRKRVRTR